MNLGDIYIKTFLSITLATFVFSIVSAVALHFVKRIPWLQVSFIAFLLWVCGSFIGNLLLHNVIFTAWHQSQNKIVPSTGCEIYKPSFSTLHATYRIDQPEFDAWIANHPWPLEDGDNDSIQLDGQRLGFDEPESSFQTEEAVSGKQLRIYFKAGKMYLVYNTM